MTNAQGLAIMSSHLALFELTVSLLEDGLVCNMPQDTLNPKPQILGHPQLEMPMWPPRKVGDLGILSSSNLLVGAVPVRWGKYLKMLGRHELVAFSPLKVQGFRVSGSSLPTGPPAHGTKERLPTSAQLPQGLRGRSQEGGPADACFATCGCSSCRLMPSTPRARNSTRPKTA